MLSFFLRRVDGMRTRPPLPPLQFYPRQHSSAMLPNTPMTVDLFLFGGGGNGRNGGDVSVVLSK